MAQPLDQLRTFSSVSELGLAQCEDKLSDDKTKRTVTPVSIIYWKQGVSIIRRKVRRRFWKERKRALSATRDFGTLYYEDRRPLCNRKPSYSVLWSALGVARI